MKTKSNDLIKQNKIFVLLAIITGLILLIPLTAMQFGGEVNWDGADIMVMGMLFFGMGSLYVLAARKVAKRHRLLLGIVAGLAFLYLWAELAVGIFTNWGS